MYNVNTKTFVDFIKHSMPKAGRGIIAIEGNKMMCYTGKDSASLNTVIIEGASFPFLELDGAQAKQAFTAISPKESLTFELIDHVLHVKNGLFSYEIDTEEVNTSENAPWHIQELCSTYKNIQGDAQLMFAMPFSAFVQNTIQALNCTSKEARTDAIYHTLIHHRDGKALAAGLNGPMFAIQPLPVNCAAFPDTLIPRRIMESVHALKKYNTIAMFKVDKTTIVMVDDIQFIFKAVEWQYPDYALFTAKDRNNAYRATFDRKMLMHIVKTFIDGGTNALVIEGSKNKIDDRTILTVFNGSTCEMWMQSMPKHITVPCTLPSYEFKIALPSTDLMYILKKMTGKTVALVFDENRMEAPFVLEDDARPNDIVIAMPMKVTDDELFG